MAEHNIRCVVFDKDGTLLDSLPYWEKAFRFRAEQMAAAALPQSEALRRELMQEMGLDPDSGRVIRGGNAGASSKKIKWDHSIAILKRHGVDPVPAAAIVEQAFAETEQRYPLYQHAHVFPEIKRCLQSLKASGVKLAVATSDVRASAEQSLTAAGLRPLIDFLVTASDVRRGKPAGDMVQSVAAALACDPSAIAVVGDTAPDLYMAQDAGAALGIAVLTGSGDPSILAALADVVLPTAADLYYASESVNGKLNCETCSGSDPGRNL